MGRRSRVDVALVAIVAVAAIASAGAAECSRCSGLSADACLDVFDSSRSRAPSRGLTCESRTVPRPIQMLERRSRVLCRRVMRGSARSKPSKAISLGALQAPCVSYGAKLFRTHTNFATFFFNWGWFGFWVPGFLGRRAGFYLRRLLREMEGYYYKKEKARKKPAGCPGSFTGPWANHPRRAELQRELFVSSPAHASVSRSASIRSMSSTVSSSPAPSAAFFFFPPVAAAAPPPPPRILSSMLSIVSR